MANLKYYGHSCWSLREGGVEILIDPFLRNNPWVEAFPEGLRPTVILLTHGHSDHLGDAIEVARKADAPVVAMVELASFCQEQGVRAIGANFGGVVGFDFGWTKIVPAWHSSSWTPPGGQMRSTIPNGFVIRFADRTYYHAGDTGLFYDMKLIGETTPIDVAMLPIGGYYTMGIDDAVKAVELLSPKVVIPMHYSTWLPIKADPEEFRSKVEARGVARCVVVKPGGEWQVSIG